MTVISASTSIPRPPRRVIWVAVAVLLALYAVMALTASTRKGLSFDEGEQLAIGYNFWRRHDFRMETANGDLVKRWAALPLLVSRPGLPGPESADWRHGEPYVVGYRFFFQSGNRPESLLLQGRSMVVLLGVVTGLLVFLCSREIFGNCGGLVSLCIFVFSPHMLAFGGMVSTEMSLCLTLLGATWCVWRLLHRVTWGRLLASLVFSGLLLLSKPTALVLLPITALLVAVKLAGGHPLEWCLGVQRTIKSRAIQTGIFGGFVLLHAVAGWGAIWAAYDFRYAASPDPADPGIVLRVRPHPDPIDSSVAATLAWSRRVHFLPEGFLYGIKWLLENNDGRQAFMDGQWRSGGWRTFFLRALWEKTSPALLLLIILGSGGWWWLRRRDKLPLPEEGPGSVRPDRAPSRYDAAPFVVLILLYFGVAMLQDLNIGHRHILPLYPAVYVLAGAVGWLCTSRVLLARTVVTFLLLWHAFDSLALYPHYLAYFSPFVGGPAQGYRHLVDSSLDWGMDLPNLKRWLDEHNQWHPAPVFLAYFGTDSPDYYKIKCRRLPGFFDWRAPAAYPLKPGIYAISATLLQSVYTQTFGPWNKVYERAYQACLKNLQLYERTMIDPAQRAALVKKCPPGFWDQQYSAYEKLRFGRLCAWLRHHGYPPDSAGYSILIWRLDAAALHDALLGPPAELEDVPAMGQGKASGGAQP